jgi:Protein of unknown function (DUF2798)
LIPKKLEPVLFCLILSACMSFVVSGISTFRAIGPVHGFVHTWVRAWLTAWPFAFPTALLMAPIARRLVRRLVAAH